MHYLYIWGQKASTNTAEAGFRRGIEISLWLNNELLFRIALILINIFTNNLHLGLNTHSSSLKIMSCCKERFDTTEGSTTIQTELSRVKCWTNKNYMNLNKKKFKVLHLA